MEKSMRKKLKISLIAFALIVVISAFIIDEPYEVKNEDAYCAGMLTRTSGLIEENIRKLPEDSQHIFLKLADLLLGNGTILVEQVLNSERKDTDTDADDMNAGASFAEINIDKNDIRSISRHGTVIREAVMQCINRVED